MFALNSNDLWVPRHSHSTSPPLVHPRQARQVGGGGRCPLGYGSYRCASSASFLLPPMHGHAVCLACTVDTGNCGKPTAVTVATKGIMKRIKANRYKTISLDTTVKRPID
jgi:hypothetical protein